MSGCRVANILPVGEREKADGRNKLMQFQRSNADTIQLPENESSIHKIVVRAVSPIFLFFFFLYNALTTSKIFHNTRLFLVKYLLYKCYVISMHPVPKTNSNFFLPLSHSFSFSVISFSLFLFCGYVKKTMDFLVVARNIGF